MGLLGQEVAFSTARWDYLDRRLHFLPPDGSTRTGGYIFYRKMGVLGQEVTYSTASPDGTTWTGGYIFYRQMGLLGQEVTFSTARWDYLDRRLHFLPPDGSTRTGG
jgi:hypothetical protein